MSDKMWVYYLLISYVRSLQVWTWNCKSSQSSNPLFSVLCYVEMSCFVRSIILAEHLKQKPDESAPLSMVKSLTVIAQCVCDEHLC